MTKRVIRPNPILFGSKDVLEDGVRVATFHFSRDSRDREGRVVITTRGRLTYEDGRVVVLDYYAWYADVARDIRNHII